MNRNVLQTFILGAGSASPYGFPLSPKLITGIKTSLIQAAAVHAEALPPGGFRTNSEIENARAFVSALGDLTSVSIDKFLNINSQWNDIGRQAIIIELLNSERSSDRPGSEGLKSDWYPYVFGEMVSELDSIDAIRNEFGLGFKFVTFNYDRSFENYVHENLKHLLGSSLNTEEVDEVARRLDITHVYGSIGALGWQSPGNDYSVEFGVESHDMFWLSNRLKDNIQLIYDQRSTMDRLQKAKEAISPANRVLFLGFGFDTKNISNLDLPLLLSGKTVYATGYGATRRELGIATSRLSGGSLRQAQMTRVLDLDNLALCREFMA